MKKLPLCFLLFVFIIINSFSISYAATSQTSNIQTENAKTLVQLNIVDSSKISNKILKSSINKYDYISLIVKMFGYDEDEALDEIDLPYKDVDKSNKSYNNIKIAYKYGIISERENGLLSPKGNITGAEAIEMVLNGLGYADDIKDFPKEDIIKKASEMGICKNINLTANKKLTYGEAYVVIYNSLTVEFK